MADPPQPPPHHPSCAACTHQGRLSCPSDCPLAPYFPADRPERFEYANLLFGVDDILRRLQAAGPDTGIRSATMASIVFVADARASDPVHGAYGVIRNLQQQLGHVKAEIAAIRQKQQAQLPPAMTTQEEEETAALEDGH